MVVDFLASLLVHIASMFSKNVGDITYRIGKKHVGCKVKSESIGFFQDT